MGLEPGQWSRQQTTTQEMRSAAQRSKINKIACLARGVLPFVHLHFAILSPLYRISNLLQGQESPHRHSKGRQLLREAIAVRIVEASAHVRKELVQGVG